MKIGVGFIEYYNELCEEDITKFVRNTHHQLIVYWDHVWLALLAKKNLYPFYFDTNFGLKDG